MVDKGAAFSHAEEGGAQGERRGEEVFCDGVWEEIAEERVALWWVVASGEVSEGFGIGEAEEVCGWGSGER